ncbi:MAG: CYTH domain-containing protein [Chitinophagales bacterium]
MPKPQEIERKFWVRSLPSTCLQYSPVPIEQGYIAIEENGHAVRLRRKSEAFSLTVKSSGGMVREEYEIAISKPQFEALWESTEGQRIVKDRYVIPYQNLQIEVDVFRGKLKGLVIAEIEFESIEAANAFQKLKWMEVEVTGNSYFNNRKLQEMDGVEAVLAYL